MKTKFSGKRPVMFYQPGKEGQETDLVHGSRIRIFYPDGDIEWGTLANLGGMSLDTYWFRESPCYLEVKILREDGSSKFVDFKPDDMKHAIRVATEFDQKEGFPKMEFLGEL